MSFPSNPPSGQAVVKNNITYVYSTATNSWRRDYSNLVDRLTLIGRYNTTVTTTGTLVVYGGVGITQNLVVGGKTILQDTLSVASNSTFTGGITALNEVNLIPNNANVTISPANGGTVIIFPTSEGFIDNVTIGQSQPMAAKFADVAIASITPSISIGTGALTVAGGAGITKDLYVGGIIYGNIIGQQIITETVLTGFAGGGPGQILYQTGVGTTGFSNTGTTGSVLVSYGRDAPVFQNYLNLYSTTPSTSATSGALTVAGGVGIGGNLNIDGSVTIGGVPLSSLFTGNPWKIINANYLAVSGDRLMINTSATSVTVTLPATPILGDNVQFVDYGYTFGLNTATIAGNGQLIMGLAEDLIIDIPGAANTFIYASTSTGWKLGAVF